MKLTRRNTIFLGAVALFAAAFTFFSAPSGAQDDAWVIVRADYGFRNQRNDVTDILKDLISRGGVNGRVAVTNQTMGGDPAVGADKILVVIYRYQGREAAAIVREGNTLTIP